MTEDGPEVRHLPEEKKCVGFSQHTPTRKKTRVEPVSFGIECVRGFLSLRRMNKLCDVSELGCENRKNPKSSSCVGDAIAISEALFLRHVSKRVV